MNLIQTEFARILGVTRQAVSKAVKDGFLIVVDGKVDTDHGVNVVWCTNSPTKASAWEKWNKRQSKLSKSEVLPVKLPVVTKKAVVKEKKTGKTVDTTESKETKKDVFVPVVHEDHLTPAQVSEYKQKVDLKHSKEKLIKALIENAMLRNKLVDRDVIEAVEERMWNIIITGLKNAGNVIVMDLEKKILANGGAQNEDYFFVENSLMEVVENAKNQKVSDLKKRIS